MARDNGVGGLRKLWFFLGSYSANIVVIFSLGHQAPSVSRRSHLSSRLQVLGLFLLYELSPFSFDLFLSQPIYWIRSSNSFFR